MALFHPPADPNKPTFAGGTMGQAMAKHKYMNPESEDDKKKKGPHAEMQKHLQKASEHLEHAKHMSEGGAKSESAEKDPHDVDEEAGGTEGGEGGMSAMMGMSGE